MTFGKVQSLMGRGHRALKYGLARAHGIYERGAMYASKANAAWEMGKRVAAIALPHFDKYAPGIQAHGDRVIGKVEGARGRAMHRIEDVHEQIRDHGRMFQRIRERVPEAGVYLGS